MPIFGVSNGQTTNSFWYLFHQLHSPMHRLIGSKQPNLQRRSAQSLWNSQHKSMSLAHPALRSIRVKKILRYHHCSITAESWLNLQVQPQEYCLFWYPNTWVVTCRVETNCCNILPKNFWWQTSTLAHKNLILWGHPDCHHAKSGFKEMLERHVNSRSLYW